MWSEVVSCDQSGSQVRCGTMKGKSKILFIIPRGEVIRNFAYTGIIQKLRENHEVHLLSVVPNPELRQYLEGISDSFQELVDIPLSYKHGYWQSVMDMSHNRYLWSEAAKVRWNMRDVEASGLSGKLKRLLNKWLARIMATETRIRFLEQRQLSSSKSEVSVQHYKSLVEEIKPDLVFNGSHSHSKIAYPVMQAARLLGIRTATFLFSWDNLTSQGRVIPPYDDYLAWNEDIKSDFLRIYPTQDTRQVHVTGTPQFSFHFDPQNRLPRQEFLKQLGLSSDQKFVLYSSGMSHHMPYEPEVAELLADILREIDPDIRLVIRTYAKDRGDVFEVLKSKRPDILLPDVKWEKNFQTPLLEDQQFFTNLLLHCELGVNVASTVSLELCMLDKPVINIGFNPPGRDIYPYDYGRFYSFDHYKPIVESGAVYVAYDPIQLKEMVMDQLENPNQNAHLRRTLINSFFHTDMEGMLKPIDTITKTLGMIVDKAEASRIGQSDLIDSKKINISAAKD